MPARDRRAAAPVWSSAFRPFFLLGAIYAPLLAAAWLAGLLGAWQPGGAALPLRLWHGHEMVFGFASAIIAGILLTALPSWAGTEEIRGGRLALLVAIWLAGRIAGWSMPGPEPVLAALAALANLTFFPAVLAMVAPQLLRAPKRLYRLLLPVLLALAAAQGACQFGILAARPALAETGLRAALYAVIVLYVLTGGLLTPVFTGNALREKGRGGQAPFNLGLETLAVAAVLLLAALDLAGARPLWTGAAALACSAVHAVRAARWQGWRVADVPLVLAMHLGFAWLVFAFVLKALADLTGRVPEAAWLHAFTVGALGLMMLGLMTRVSLRHTGRPLGMPQAMRLACGLMFAAALLRLAATVHGLGTPAVAVSVVLWALPFALFLLHFGAALVAPSLPRDGAT